MPNNSLRALLPLTVLGALLSSGVIAQVLIETYFGRPVEVNSVLATLAGIAVTALFGQQSFLGHTAASSVQRADLLTALIRTTPTPSAPIGIGTGGPGAATAHPAATTGPVPATPPI